MKKREPSLHVFHVELEVLSPVAIGAGKNELLSPYTDYVPEGKYVHLIDQKKFMALLVEDSRLVDEYVRGVRMGMGDRDNRSKFSLGSFIKNELNCHLDDITRLVIEAKLDSGQKLPIQRCISSNGIPYIPGSSLKGALRTSLMFAWLLNGKSGKAARVAYENIIEAYKYAGANSYRGRAKEFLELPTEALCFGDIENDLLRQLFVTDAHFVETSSRGIYSRTRYSVVAKRNNKKGSSKKKDGGGLTTLEEAISTGARLRGEIRFQSRIPAEESDEKTKSKSEIKPSDPEYFEFLQTGDIESLVRKARDIGLCNVEREIQILQIADQIKGLPNYELPLSFYYDLKAQIKTLAPNQLIVRLGAGKTWFDQTYGLIFNRDQKSRDKYLKQFLGFALGSDFEEFRVETPEKFPSTRSFVKRKNKPAEPFGWVKLTFTPKGAK